MTPDSGSPEVSVPEEAPNPERGRFRWLPFLGLLIAPGFLTPLALVCKMQGLAVAIPLIGGGVVAIFSGIILGRRFGKTPATMVFLGILLGLLFGFASFVLGFAGCMAGGFQLDMR